MYYFSIRYTGETSELWIDGKHIAEFSGGFWLYNAFHKILICDGAFSALRYKREGNQIWVDMPKDCRNKWR